MEKIVQKIDFGYGDMYVYGEADFDSNEQLQVPLKKLYEYEHMEETGQLLVLPVAEGDTVWVVENNTDACYDCDNFVIGHCCDSYCDHPDVDVVDANCCNIAEDPVCPKQFYEIVDYKPNWDWIVLHRKDFGKTVFLSQEEAEIALKKQL